MAIEKKSSFSRDEVKEDANMVLLDRFICPEIYVDGVSQILLGYPMVKVAMYTVIEAGAKEIRRATVTLAMDTPTALEVAFSILDSCGSIQEGLLNTASSSTVTKLKKLLERIPSVSPNGAQMKFTTEPKQKVGSARIEGSEQPVKPARKVVKKVH